MYNYGGKAMLTKFSVENYKSFNKKISIDLTRARDYDFNKTAIKNGIIKDAVIFGSNGCGKSNFSLALFDIVPTLTDKQFDPLQMDPSSFLNFDSKKKYATFCYEFLYNNHKISYEYKKSGPRIIIEEQLICDNHVIYKCNTQTKCFEEYQLDSIGYDSFNKENYEFDLPFLRFMRNNTSHKEDSIIKFIFEFVNKMLWFRSLQTNSYIGVKNGTEFVTPWIIENNYVKEFEAFLNSVGGLDIKLDIAVTNNPMPQKSLIFVNSDNTKGLSFDTIKSSGTNAMLILFYWYKQLNDVSFIFIDEFDAFYHFDLSKRVIELFKNIENIQAIFTSHNTYIANNDILRPDCYFTLSNGEIKSFIDRTKRELREGHNLEKLLRSGEFNE